MCAVGVSEFAHANTRKQGVVKSQLCFEAVKMVKTNHFADRCSMGSLDSKRNVFCARTESWEHLRPEGFRFSVRQILPSLRMS